MGTPGKVFPHTSQHAVVAAVYHSPICRSSPALKVFFAAAPNVPEHPACRRHRGWRGGLLGLLQEAGRRTGSLGGRRLLPATLLLAGTRRFTPEHLDKP